VAVAERQMDRARWRFLHNFVHLLEPAMAVLGIAWMVLLVIEFTRGLSPVLALVNRVIWVVFVADFIAELLVAPKKLLYLKRHWIVAISLAVPAVRVLRFARVARAGRALRGVRLVRVIGSLNRAMSALRTTMRRRGFGYVSALTLVTMLGGAAAMYQFENGVPDPAGIHDFGTAVWWTAMIMTTLGSAYWPETAEGRVLCVLLALYSFAVFGYVTATLSTFFIDQDANRNDAAIAGQSAVNALAAEVARLRDAIERQRGA
jgi:voltage-gated potassium channel